MKLSIDLDEAFLSEGSIADAIKDEVHSEVRRLVKRMLKDKQSELAQSVERYARQQARIIEDKLLGLSG